VKHRLFTPAVAVAVITAAALAPAAADASLARPVGAAAAFPSFVVVNHASSLEVFDTSTGAAAGTLHAPGGQKFQGVASGGTSRAFLAYASQASATATCHAYYYRFQLAATGKPSALTALGSFKNVLPTAAAAPPGGGADTFSTVHCYPPTHNGRIAVTGPARTRSWAYDLADDYTFALAATANGDTLALSMFIGSTGARGADLLLNTHSRSATVEGASRVVPHVPYADALAISPSGATLYACISHGPKAELAAYSAVTGHLVRVLHRWTLGQAGAYFCQVSADATGQTLLASYSSTSSPHTSLIGINAQTGKSVTLPVHGDYVIDGIQAAW
jgi:hypothetical protein